MNDEIDYERPPGAEPPDETDISLRAYLSRLSDDHLTRYQLSWSDERVIEWDGNFCADGALMLVCCERDVEIEEYRRELELHLKLRAIPASPDSDTG